ncbi:MAG: tetratricopeptide repeat protein [Treponema sp.]|nr:tetratricopeptide repeat protein [Treponema sp.]
MKSPLKFRFKIFALLLFVSLFPFLISCASSGAVSAEEYFSIGMAYYDMGKYADAEQWLNRAKASDKTMVASEYNLGRIAFETGRYEEAAVHFENILKQDPQNVMALKGAAYSRIKNGDLDKAETLYNRLLVLIPESVDDGYNYALVLYSLKKYENCEEVLDKYPYALETNDASLLLLARTQKAQNKVEAVDTYAKWATAGTGQTDPQGLYEYAQALDAAGFYARALEQYKAAINALTADTDTLKKSKLRFEEARLLLTADPDNSDGLTELNTSITEGFSDTAAVQALLDDNRISAANQDEIRKILSDMVNNSNNASTDSSSTDNSGSTDNNGSGGSSGDNSDQNQQADQQAGQ